MTGGGRYARVEDANQTPGTSVNCFHENRTYCGILVPKMQQNRFRRTDKDQDNAILLQIDQSGECMCHMSGQECFQYIQARRTSRCSADSNSIPTR